MKLKLRTNIRLNIISISFICDSFILARYFCHNPTINIQLNRVAPKAVLTSTQLPKHPTLAKLYKYMHLDSLEHCHHCHLNVIKKALFCPQNNANRPFFSLVHRSEERRVGKEYGYLGTLNNGRKKIKKLI